MRPIPEIAGELGLADNECVAWGPDRAKIRLAALKSRAQQPDGRLVLVSAMTPTPAGEGKTTTAIALADGLRHIGKKSVVALREPSLGPCFGRKGGGTGAGKALLYPADDINLHFTGDLHAVSSAHNLLSATIDNHLFHGNELGIDPRAVLWPRAVDMNDRALRSAIIGMAVKGQSYLRDEQWIITAASEIMAVLCLSSSVEDLQERLGRMVIARKLDGTPATVNDLGIAGAMTALLVNAIDPNLVQTVEGTPAIVHGGPFANIAHGCNSIVGTRMALKLGDICVTEAGFGSDLGAEKFFDIKCRVAELKPDAACVVATLRAIKYHAGLPIDQPNASPDALKRGLKNLRRHIQIIQLFGVPPVVALNRFGDDTDEEIETVRAACAEEGAPLAISNAFAEGAAGAAPLAEAVVQTLEERPSEFRLLYASDEELTVQEKINKVAFEVYDAMGVHYTGGAKKSMAQIERWGFDRLPVCIAKTHLSLTDDPKKLGKPLNVEIKVTGLSVSAGAGFIVVRLGDVLLMPGLPARPAAENISVSPDGKIQGLS